MQGGGSAAESQGPGNFHLVKPPCSPSKVTADWGTENRGDTWDNGMGSGVEVESIAPMHGTLARWSHGSRLHVMSWEMQFGEPGRKSRCACVCDQPPSWPASSRVLTFLDFLAVF